MRRSDQSRCREEFSRAIDHAIVECSRATGITDVDTVDQYLKKSAKILFRRISLILAKEQRRILIQKRLKHCTVSVREAEASLKAEAQQLPLFDIFEMDQFRGVPRRITYPAQEGREVVMKYVEYNRSLEWQRTASVQHLGRGIDADIARKEAETAANEFLHPLVKKFGDLPAEELIRLWRGGEAALPAQE